MGAWIGVISEESDKLKDRRNSVASFLHKVWEAFFHQSSLDDVDGDRSLTEG